MSERKEADPTTEAPNESPAAAATAPGAPRPVAETEPSGDALTGNAKLSAEEKKHAAHSDPNEKKEAGLPEVVTFRNVTKSFGEGEERKVAVEDVSFVVHDLPGKGELVCIVGPSGCGKSTVLRMIAGLAPQFPPTSGEALVFGKPIAGPSADRGVVDQKYSLLPHLTVIDNIGFGLRLRGVAYKERRALAS